MSQRLRRLWLAMVIAAMAAEGAMVPAAANDGGTSPAAVAMTPAASPAKDDYYTQRARRILERERRAIEQAPHPLALAHPDEAVVVCEAGCAKPDVPEIVFSQPKQQDAGMLVPTAARMDTSADNANAPSLIECVGGCYGPHRAYTSRAPVPRSPFAGTEAEASLGEWMTTVDKPADTPPRRNHLSPIR